MNKFSIGPSHVLLLCIILIISSFNIANGQKIEGYVFIDNNNNSIKDQDERGLSGVMVSNQKEVVITDQEGYFQIKPIEGNFIFVTKPESYQFNLDEYNNPEFYFLYKKKKTKEKLKYPGLEPMKEVPEVLYFPLHENFDEEKYSCLLLGDPQMINDKKLNYYIEGTIPHMAVKNADFYIILGDIAHNKLGILPKEKSASATLGIPGYRVMGNHDINFKAYDNDNAQETFNKIFGPDFYSFDYGSVHYIVLNSIIYSGWWDEVNAPGNYTGDLTNQQIQWLKNDLSYVSPNKTIVLLSHIPLHEVFISKKSILEVFSALENHKKILAVSGHLHTIIAYDYDSEQGWVNGDEFEGLVAGAVCGSWWSGPEDLNNIPFSTCLDGSPKGFFQLNVTKNDYSYNLNAVNYPSDYQMKTYIKDNEIWVNWFVGKRTDSVWVYLDNKPQALSLYNFTSEDPYMELRFAARKHIDTHIKGIPKTAHLWKRELPDTLKSGIHSVKIIARDSKGRIFSGFKTFYKSE